MLGKVLVSVQEGALERAAWVTILHENTVELSGAVGGFSPVVCLSLELSHFGKFHGKSVKPPLQCLHLLLQSQKRLLKPLVGTLLLSADLGNQNFSLWRPLLLGRRDRGGVSKGNCINFWGTLAQFLLFG